MKVVTPTIWEILITCPPIGVGYLEELLWTLPGVESVSEHYRTNAEHDETHRSDITGVSVVMRTESEASSSEPLVRDLLESHPKLKKVCAIANVRIIRDADWADQWKQHWHPTRITPTLTICPTWEANSYQAAPDERVMLLDPECAFGTGTHETTRLMLQAMETLAKTVDFSQVNVLDIGTGSGILAIDAALRGCKDVRGIDCETAAVETALKNAALNNVATATDFSDTPLNELCMTRYDVVLVNIIAPVIQELWPDILARLNPGGHLLASGLIEKSVGTIEATMQAVGFTDIQRFNEGDWFALHGIAAQNA